MLLNDKRESSGKKVRVTALDSSLLSKIGANFIMTIGIAQGHSELLVLCSDPLP